MLKASAHFVLVGAGLAIGAMLGALAAPTMIGPRGALGPSVLHAASPAGAVVAAVGVLIVALVLGCIVGRLRNTAVGLFVAASAPLGLAWNLADARELALSGSILPIIIEQVVWFFLILGLALLIFRVSGGFRDVLPTPEGERPHPLLSGDALRSGACGLIMVPAVMLLARSMDKGQALGVAFTGAMVAGLAGRLVAPNVQPILVTATPILGGAVAYAIGWFQLGSTDMTDALVSGTIPPALRVMPPDYVAGALAGSAIGFGWAKSFLHGDQPRSQEGVPAKAPSGVVIRSPAATDRTERAAT